MPDFSESDLIGAEVISVDYIDKEGYVNYSIKLKLKNGRFVSIGPTTWETLWIAEETDTFINLLDSVDRWKSKDSSDPLAELHIKVKDYDIENKMITFSWWDGKQGLEEDLSFGEFQKRFEKKY